MDLDQSILVDYVISHLSDLIPYDLPDYHERLYETAEHCAEIYKDITPIDLNELLDFDLEF